MPAKDVIPPQHGSILKRLSNKFFNLEVHGSPVGLVVSIHHVPTYVFKIRRPIKVRAQFRLQKRKKKTKKKKRETKTWKTFCFTLKNLKYSLKRYMTSLLFTTISDASVSIWLRAKRRAICLSQTVRIICLTVSTYHLYFNFC